MTFHNNEENLTETNNYVRYNSTAVFRAYMHVEEIKGQII